MAERSDANTIDKHNIKKESRQIKPASKRSCVGDFDDLSEFLDSIPVVLYECDIRLKVTRLTANTERIIGVGHEDLCGPEGLWRGILFPDDRESLFNLLATLESGETATAIHRIFDKRRLPVWVCHSFTKAFTADGGIVRGCILPVSGQIWTQKIDTSTIPQFVHKLGNHFQLINLLLENLRASGVPLAEIEQLQLAMDDTADFTRTFLDYAQAPSGRSEFDLSFLLTAVTETMEPVFAEKKVALHHDSSDLTNRTLVLGDPFLLEKAFYAILQNALDATSEGGKVEVIGCREQHRYPAESAHMVISDTGCGMEQEVLTRAAVAFFTTRRDRNGLGLSMALRIIEQHGGTMRINSAMGQGTQIHIMLPIIKTSKLPIVRAE